MLVAHYSIGTITFMNIGEGKDAAKLNKSISNGWYSRKTNIIRAIEDNELNINRIEQGDIVEYKVMDYNSDDDGDIYWDYLTLEIERV